MERKFVLHSPFSLLHSSSFLHPRLISPVEGERWRGSFPPLMGGIKGGCSSIIPFSLSYTSFSGDIFYYFRVGF